MADAAPVEIHQEIAGSQKSQWNYGGWIAMTLETIESSDRRLACLIARMTFRTVHTYA
jgi:hypothetical protein